jgi:hypothetical protein
VWIRPIRQICTSWICGGIFIASTADWTSVVDYLAFERKFRLKLLKIQFITQRKIPTLLQMLFREIIYVYSLNNTKHRYTLFSWNAKLRKIVHTDTILLRRVQVYPYDFNVNLLISKHILRTIIVFIESSGDWLQRRPRLTQGCSAEEEEGSFSIILSPDIILLLFLHLQFHSV